MAAPYCAAVIRRTAASVIWHVYMRPSCGLALPLWCVIVGVATDQGTDRCTQIALDTFDEVLSDSSVEWEDLIPGPLAPESSALITQPPSRLNSYEYLLTDVYNKITKVVIIDRDIITSSILIINIH